MTNSQTPTRSTFTRWLSALLVFGITFGFVEAAVVVYLRDIYDPIHDRLNPHKEPGDLFPILRPDQLEEQGPERVRGAIVEIAREAATLGLLAALALAAASNARQWFAAFAVSFGLWDIFYYVFLKLILDWPESLFTWDILFLIPVPWVGPVIAPAIVSVSMIAAGTAVLWRECEGRPLRVSALDWAAVAAGAFVLVAAFIWDAKNIMIGGLPSPFHWPLFWLGEALGAAAFLHAWWSSRLPEPPMDPRLGPA